jgi:uncharacterized Zn-finger protein
MVRRICDTTSSTKGGLSQDGGFVSTPHCGPWLFDLELNAAYMNSLQPGNIESASRLALSTSLEFWNLRQSVMADHVVPHFQNDAGVALIEIGSREFMCVGANPPFDHPHVFLDLGNDNEIICPYCSTLFRYAADLGAGEARPPECVLKDKAA